MCIVALALDQSAAFPLVIAANRDEYFDRPTAPLDWWRTNANGLDTGAPILGGRDLKEGGTWLGLNLAGRLALVTNIRTPGLATAVGAPSRGHLVPHWLNDPRRYEPQHLQMAQKGYRPFNLIAADFANGDCFWANSARPSALRLPPGLHGLSNADLDTPWPKVLTLKHRVAQALHRHPAADALDALVEDLFAALSDRRVAADALLPSTGIPLAWERALSPIFIHTDDGHDGGSYGTRCSTLVITLRMNGQRLTHVIERSFAGGPGAPRQRQATLIGWPAPAGPREAASLPAVHEST